MKLIIITGITGKLGDAYLRHFTSCKNVKCIGFARRNPEIIYPKADYRFVDLLDKKEVHKEISIIDFKKYSDVVFIHPIGMFKFERLGKPLDDRNKDGIDDNLFASNVMTFINIFNPLQKVLKKEKVKLTVCAFGSITDRYNIPFWISYTRCKNKLRNFIKKSIINNNYLRSIFINVSTVDTGNERNLRPFANRSYWLTPDEIVNTSLPLILSNKNKWNEINIYKYNPDFNPIWYTNHENVLERWEKQMGNRIINKVGGKTK